LFVWWLRRVRHWFLLPIIRHNNRKNPFEAQWGYEVRRVKGTRGCLRMVVESPKRDALLECSVPANSNYRWDRGGPYFPPTPALP
jgi:hypothetical protein